MLNWIVSTFQQLAPSSSVEFVLFNQARYRALRPTWPVVLSLILLAAASIIPDQGRAIVKLAGRTPVTSLNGFAPVILLVIHSCIMMYTAFMLAAVTRRSHLDAAENSASTDNEPVDPSIKLREGFAYICGVFLPLTYTAMSLFFLPDNFDPEFEGIALVSGILAGVVFAAFADKLYLVAARRYANSVNRQNTIAISGFRYVPWYILRAVCHPSYRRIQIAIASASVALIILVTLLVFSSENHSINYLSGVFKFFAAFVVVHFVFRSQYSKIIRLHQGQTARYIIINHNFDLWFQRVRRILVISIIIALWVPSFVSVLGSLGVMLLGTLWITLVLSGITERAARINRETRGQTVQRTQRLTTKIVIFSTLIALLFLDGTLWVLESFSHSSNWSDKFFSALPPLILASLLIYAFYRRKDIWKEKRGGLRAAIAQLPTATFLSPLLFLGYGEAHHVHRIEIDASLATAVPANAADNDGLANNPAQTAASASRVLSLDEHAENWVAARHASASESGSPIPAIIILAEGGGIRAGAHAGYFLSHLDTALINHCNAVAASRQADTVEASNSETDTEPMSALCTNENSRLLDHVYSINGVSGGSVGSAVYLAAVREERKHGLTPGDRHTIIDETLREDYMSPLFAGMFGADILTGALPIQIPDRFAGLNNRRSTDPAQIGQVDHRGIFDRADFFECMLTNTFHDQLVLAAARENERREMLQLDQSGIEAEGLIPPLNASGTEPNPCSFIAGRLKVEKTFDLPLEHIAYEAGRRDSETANSPDPGPMVFFSTFYENGGFQMATANVDILPEERGSADTPLSDPAFCGSVPIVQQLLYDYTAPDQDATVANGCRAREQTLPLSAAAHLSARFPGSNPTGVIETRDSTGQWRRHFFVDGGYLDNSGTLSAIQSLQALRSAAKDREANLNVVVLHLHSLSIAATMENDSAHRPKKQDEFSRVPSAVLKARGAASRAPVRMLCNALTGYADDDSDHCDEIFERRTPDDMHPDVFNKHYAHRLRDGEPVLEHLLERLPLRTGSSGDDPIIAASWIPVPLEVARNDRQTNATTALLGWALLEETSQAINCVMQGSARIAGE
ncbi:MAG: hypothetical protein AAF683_09495, partial [Pseudomonadota bacterium]